MRLLLTLLAFVAFLSVSAQSFTTKNVMTLGEGKSPAATIDDMAFLQGYWTGDFFGGHFEEIWSPPASGAMMGSFKQMNADTVNFYEIEIVKEVGNSLAFMIKHFHNDLKGWEEKDEVVNWPLVKIADDRVYFDGITFEKLDKDHIKVYLAVSFEDGSIQEFTTTYNRGTL